MNPPTERLPAEELQAIRERANYERISTSIWQERQDIAALLADREVLERELAGANEKWRLYEREYILPCFEWAKESGIDLEALVREAKGNCVKRLVQTLQAELQEARGNFDLLARAYPKAEKDAIDLWRTQLVAAVRAEPMIYDRTSRENVIKLIQSFNPAPDKGE